MSDQRQYRLQFIHESPPLHPPFPSTISVVYLISKSWWLQWCEYSGYYSTSFGREPGQITNSSINLSNPNPEDYIYLTKVTWRRLKNWYKYDVKRIAFVLNNQPDFSHITTVVSIEQYNTHCIQVPLWYSLFQFKTRVQKKLKLTGYKCKFRMVFANGNDQLLNENGKSLNELEFYDNVKIRVDCKSRPEKIVTFAGYGNDDEEEDLKKAMAASLTQAESQEIDQEKILKVKQSLADMEKEKKYRLEYKPLPELIKNIEKIFESLTSC